MAFGQASGPPASAQQITELASLLGRAGYESFREARYPFDFSQRQANGKFTRDEASELIERLTAAEEVRESLPPSASPPSEPDPVVATLADEVLADELVRRGWTCIAPT